MSRLLVAGSIALDTIDTAAGRVEEELGGSALYFALAATLICPVDVVAPVGEDAVEAVTALLRGRDANTSGLSVLRAPTYRWRARHEGGHNLDLGSRDSIYDAWMPEIPSDRTGWAFIGSMRPAIQLQIARALAGAELLAADAMLSYTLVAPAEAAGLLAASNWFFCNAAELRALGWEGTDAGEFRRRHGLAGLCVKAGPEGATVFAAGAEVRVPALASRTVVDTTGAGDALAGGMLARWLTIGGDPELLEDALIHGVACASIVIEDVGLRGLARATPHTLRRRVQEVRRWIGRPESGPPG